MAEMLGISASYLNLIEHDRRPLTAPLLIKLAQSFEVDIQDFATDDSSILANGLLEMFGDPLFDGFELRAPEVRELALGNPNVARAVMALYESYRTALESTETLASRVSETGGVAGVELSPAEEVTALLQRHGNYFAELEEAAETLWSVARLDAQTMYRGLVRYLMEAHGVLVKVVPGDPQVLRRFDTERRRLVLSEVLAPRSKNFQLAHQIALLSHGAILDRIVEDGTLNSTSSRALGRVVLANYFAGCVLMPYQLSLEAARAVRYDIEMLGHRFRTSFEQVCHRLTSLRRPGAEGVPFHMVRVDIAGNISKRFSASGIRFARYSGACPRWNVYNAFLTPGMIRTQVSEMPDGSRFFCMARTVRRHTGGYHDPHSMHAIGLGCALEHAKELVYADNVDLQSQPVPIGVSCRMCPRIDCDQRAFPPMERPLRVDENIRAASVYTPPVDD